jgi:PPK2 family polyphosphate:nucleotide phosphotransferase
MDAAGKDSTIEKLTLNLGASGCQVASFKKPSKKELAHDFLWRVHKQVPEQGGITIFNRSHYEDVLIVKVHGWADEQTIERRYEHIKNFESLLADSGTKVIKFMLNISTDYQLERFRQRLENPEKNWKFNPGDLDERALWGDYMQAFSTAIERTSTEDAPWYIVPAQNRRFRDLMVASVILQHLKEMNPQYPEPDYDPAQFNSQSLV